MLLQVGRPTDLLVVEAFTSIEKGPYREPTLTCETPGTGAAPILSAWAELFDPNFLGRSGQEDGTAGIIVVCGVTGLKGWSGFGNGTKTPDIPASKGLRQNLTRQRHRSACQAIQKPGVQRSAVSTASRRLWSFTGAVRRPKSCHIHEIAFQPGKLDS
jgi:hypothetical protein